MADSPPQLSRFLAVAVRMLLFAVGSCCYALLNVLSQLSKEPDGSYAYSMPTVVLTAEFVKLLLSLGSLSRELGSPLAALHAVASTSPLAWCYFAGNSILYSINNNLDMLNNQYMDPATESVLVQLKIITTGVLCRVVFSKMLHIHQWVALGLLFVGCTLAAWPNESVGKTMYIEPFGLVLICIYVTISATASVYNEWLYKGVAPKDSIHLCNARLYIIGVMFCAFTHWRSTGRGISIGSLFQGYNVYTWSLVITYSVMGLILGHVLKYFDSIVKLFISGSSMYASAILTVVLFERVPSPLFLVSMGLVSVAILLYRAEYLHQLLGGGREEKRAHAD